MQIINHNDKIPNSNVNFTTKNVSHKPCLIECSAFNIYRQKKFGFFDWVAAVRPRQHFSVIKEREGGGDNQSYGGT